MMKTEKKVTLNFGRHKGQPLDELPYKYLDQLLWGQTRTRDACNSTIDKLHAELQRRIKISNEAYNLEQERANRQ